MKHILSILIFAVFSLPAPLYAASDAIIPNDKLKLGRAATATADKYIEFEKKLGAANPKIKAENSTGKIKFCHDGVTCFEPLSATPDGTTIENASGTLQIPVSMRRMLSRRLVTSWSQIAHASGISSVAYSPSLKMLALCTTDAGTRIKYSSNGGKTWSAASTPNPDAENLWQKIIWVEQLGKFVVVGGYPGGNSKYAMTSSDGINWAVHDTPSPTNMYWYDVAWSPSLQLLVAVGTPSSQQATAQSVMTSPDGVNWTLQTTPAAPFPDGGSAWWVSVSWSEQSGKFIAVSRSSSSVHKWMYSTDGITWTLGDNSLCPDASAANIINTVSWEKDLSLWYAAGSNRIFTSPDGVTWTKYVVSASFKVLKYIPEIAQWVGGSASGANSSIIWAGPNPFIPESRATSVNSRSGVAYDSFYGTVIIVSSEGGMHVTE